MTKNQYIAQVLRAHQKNLSKLLNEFDMGPINVMLESMHDSLGNVASELTKMPSPAMAEGTKRSKFDPKPNSTAKKPIPRPKKPSPAMAA